MQDGFAAERVQRQEDFASMRKEMKDEMGEGFKNERMARGQAQKEMRSDIRSEIRSEMDIMREELEQFKRGSGSTVRSEVSTAAVSGGSSTFAQPPPSIATRYESHFWPRRMEFKGWIERSYDQCSLQGITMDETRKFIVDLQKMIPEESHKYMDWDQTNNQQGPWPTKNMASMWFKNETNLVVVIDLLRTVKEELKRGPDKLRGREVVPRMEASPQQKPLKRAHAMKALTAVKKRINVVHGKLQISFFVDKKLVAKYTPEGEGLANEGWDLWMNEIEGICSDWRASYFELMVKKELT